MGLSSPRRADGSPADRAPNVVLILTDDQGYGDIHSHGNEKLDTPVLDRLAADGARFDRFYVNPICAPTRASLLTGRYHPRCGASGVSQGTEVMRLDEVTLAQVFRRAGYATGCFGKWHNGENYPYHPNGKGFDEFVGFCGGHWDNYFDTTLERNGEPFRTTRYITDELTDAALAFIEARRDRPFFCYVPYNAPHEPMQVPERCFEKYRKRGFDGRTATIYGMVENIDDNVGRILATLDRLDLAHDTIVVFLTDNGANGRRYNAGMKGWKGSPDEGGCRVPCFVRWTGRIDPGTVVRPIAAHIDILPTLAEWCGIRDTQTKPLDGVSLVPLFAGREADWPDRAIFEPRGAVRTERWRLITKGKRPQLYDMPADPGQERDVADEHPEVAAKLAMAFRDWNSEVEQGLEGMPPPIPVGHAEWPVAHLNPHRAEVRGVGRTTRWTNGWLTDWKETSGTVAWEIDVAAAGRHEVALMYTCQEADVGATMRVTAGEASAEGTVDRAHDPDPMRGRRDIREARPEKDWAPLVLGTLDLPKGRTTLQVRATDIPGSQALEMKSVRLTRLD